MRIKSGFTLAELLIALGILGVIAAFAIPKIIASNQSKAYSSEAKEIAAIVSAVFTNYYATSGGENFIQEMSLTGWDSGLGVFLPQNLNYVKRLTSGETMSYPPGGATQVYGGENACDGGWHHCYQLANGGVVWWRAIPYGWSGLWEQPFWFDPDGTGPLESQGFIVYCSTLSGQKPGRVVSVDQGSVHFYSANASWFSW